jgi:membrane-bound lytic murein transglycosylase B
MAVWLERTKAWLAAGLGLVCLLAVSAAWAEQAASDPARRPEARDLIQRMVEQHGFDRQRLQHLFARVRLQPKIVAAMNRPAEAKPWYDYRTLVVDEGRIRGGAEFRRRHDAALRRASERYGVDPEVITAIIGVETRYGKVTGAYRVIDALATLGFDYPRRGAFFRKELEQYLLLTREEGVDPLTWKGSYAGAMGLAQFMPSSYREYAVDFDGDGRRDLMDDVEDAIGSVANYLHRHGWRAAGPVAVPAKVRDVRRVEGLPGGLERPEIPLSRLVARGVRPLIRVAGDPPATLIGMQESKDRMVYWTGFENFYVITRYNRSPKYAMAVYDLSREIGARLRDEETVRVDDRRGRG